MKMYQIAEDDLADMERLVPELSISLMEHIKPKERTIFRRVKGILSDVRWRYGPPTDVEVIPAEE